MSTRRKRGELRQAILYLLSERALHGYKLLQEFRRRRWGVPSPGSIYPLLATLESTGLLVSHDDEGRRIYEITAEGRRALGEQPARLEQEREAEIMEPRIGTDVVDEANRLQASTLRLIQAVSQIDAASSTETIIRVRELLDAARREIYGLLAAD